MNRKFLFLGVGAVAALVALLSLAPGDSTPTASADTITSTFDIVVCDGTTVGAANNPAGCNTAKVGTGDDDGKPEAGEEVEVRTTLKLDTSAPIPATEPFFDLATTVWGAKLIPGNDAATNDGAFTGKIVFSIASNLVALPATSNIDSSTQQPLACYTSVSHLVLSNPGFDIMDAELDDVTEGTVSDVDTDDNGDRQTEGDIF